MGSENGRDRALVVLLHGIGRGRSSMALLAARLQRAGFEVARLGYRSRRANLDTAAREVLEQLHPLAQGRPALHLVGHSMGGLVALRLRVLAPDLPPGRTVQIGSPNRGTGLARLAARLRPVRGALGPALEEMAGPDGTPAPAEVGAIAGTGGIPALTRFYGVGGPNDGKVSVQSAWGRARHRTTVPASHATLPFSASVARQTIAFLSDGRFAGEGAA